MSNENHDAFKVMLMQAIDGCLPDDDRGAWQTHLSTCEECRREYEEFTLTADHMNAFRDRILHERSHRPQAGPMSKGGAFSVMAIVLGTVLMWGFSIWHMVTAPDVPLAIRIGHVIVVLGLTVGLAVAGRDRLRTLKSDPYSEVER